MRPTIFPNSFTYRQAEKIQREEVCVQMFARMHLNLLFQG